MKIYYHVTKKENLESIMTNGLIPKIGEMSQDLGEEIKRVYLFKNIKDMEDALMNWMGEWYEDNYGDDLELCSLIINLPDNFNIINEESLYEAYSYKIIEPKYISYFREE